MSYSVLMYISRKEGTTPAAFKEYYETKHVPIIKRISGNLFPARHSRHYIGFVPQSSDAGQAPSSTSGTAPGSEPPAADGADERVKTAQKLLAGQGATAGQHIPMVVQGAASHFDWDVCTILTYTNETHFREFMATLMDPANAKLLADDEEVFMDRSKFRAVILGENLVTVNEEWGKGA